MYDINEHRKVFASIPNVFDREIRVSTIEGPRGEPFVEIREYVPSTDTYSRGVVFPQALRNSVLKGIESTPDTEDTDE